MTEQTTAYIGLGSNLGDRKACIGKALEMLAGAEGIELAGASDIIETAPLGGDNPEYLNAVAEITTTRSAEDLHKVMADIETSLGRTRPEKFSPRTIDLDLLLFGSEVINSPDLTVPHSQMHLRSFVLKGLCQLRGELLHPVLGETVTELAGRLGGADFLPDPEAPQLISIAGVIGVGKTTLAKKLSDIFNGKLLLEPYDTNPFMPDVYAGKKEMALDSQLYFLNSRAGQLNPDALLQRQVAITDYIFDKELIYAKRLLDEKQLALYEQTYPPLAANIIAPALVIYLTGSTQKCLERIHKRNRPYEQKIQLQFLTGLDGDYEQLFSDWKTCPVIRRGISKFDCTKDADVNNLANQIRKYIAV